MSTCGDLDQLCEAVSDLTLRKGLQECEIQEGVHWGVVCTQTVLVVAVVDGDLDTDTGIDQANDCGWDTDEVCVSPVGGTRKSKRSS